MMPIKNLVIFYLFTTVYYTITATTATATTKIFFFIMFSSCRFATNINLFERQLKNPRHPKGCRDEKTVLPLCFSQTLRFSPYRLQSKPTSVTGTTVAPTFLIFIYEVQHTTCKMYATKLLTVGSHQPPTL